MTTKCNYRQFEIFQMRLSRNGSRMMNQVIDFSLIQNRQNHRRSRFQDDWLVSAHSKKFQMDCCCDHFHQRLLLSGSVNLHPHDKRSSNLA